MRLVFSSGRIAVMDYGGHVLADGDEAIEAPAEFDPAVSDQYRLIDGVLYGPGLSDPPPEVPEMVWDYQFAGQAAVEGFITEEQGLAWASRGEVPQIMVAAVDQALADDPERKSRVMYFLSSSKQYPRYHALTPLLGAILGLDTAEKLDAYFIAASLR